MKSILAISAIATIASASFFVPKPSEFLKQAKEDWPSIDFPNNFVLEAGLFTYNNLTGGMDPWKNATLVEYQDADNNRALVYTNLTIESFGLFETQTYIDYSAG